MSPGKDYKKMSRGKTRARKLKIGKKRRKGLKQKKGRVVRKKRLLRVAEETNVYVLQLQHGKYYVGRTANCEARVRQHLRGRGSAWTRLHKPVALLELHRGVSVAAEDAITKQYMKRHGWQNVRGGAHCRVNLREEDLLDRHKEIYGQLDLCLRCGRAGHWAARCRSRIQVLET